MVLKEEKFDTTLFIMCEKDDFLIVQIYVDGIIFGATIQNCVRVFLSLCRENLR